MTNPKDTAKDRQTVGTVKVPWDYPFDPPKRTSYTPVIYRKKRGKL